SSGTVASSRKASKATFALNAASSFLRDFVISLAPLVKTEQDATHLNRWSQNRGPLQRFHPGRSLSGVMIAGQKERPEERDPRITVGSVTFCTVDGVIWGKVRDIGW